MSVLLFLFLRETKAFFNRDAKHAVEKERWEMQGNRLIEASEKGGDGVHSIRMLLSDCCWDCGAEGQLLSLALQSGRDSKVVKWATSCCF